MKNLNTTNCCLQQERNLFTKDAPPLARNRKQRKWITMFILSLGFILLPTTLKAWQYEHVETGVDEYGPYIEFRLDYYYLPTTFLTSYSWATNHDLEIKDSNGNWVSLFGITSQDCGRTTCSGDINYIFKVWNYGRAFIRVNNHKKQGWSICNETYKWVQYDLYDCGYDKRYYAYIRIYWDETNLGKSIEYRSNEVHKGNVTLLPSQTVPHPIRDNNFKFEELNYDAEKPGHAVISYKDFNFDPSHTIPKINILYGNGSADWSAKDESEISNRTYYTKLYNYRHPFYLTLSLTYQGNRVFQKQKSFTPKSYIQPENFNGIYDPNTALVTLSWKTPTINAADAKYTNDDFEIEYSLNEDFSDAQNLTSVEYEIGKTSYNVTHNVASISTGEPTIYYRIRRTGAKDIWRWDYCTKINLELSKANHIYIDNAAITADNAAATATLTAYTKGSYMSPDSKYIVERTNRSSGLINSYEFDINDDNRFEFTFVDDELITCNYFTYTVYVKPGDTSFNPVKVKATPTDGIIITDIGTLSTLDISKGYYHDRVSLQWKSRGAFDEFIVKRVPYEGGDTVYIGSVAASTSGTYTTDDTKAVAGTYYSYLVYGTVKCGKDIFMSQDTLTGVGFRSPTGEISGRVTFESGQGVDNVVVELQGENTASGKSVYLPVAGGSLYVPAHKEIISDNNFSFEAYFKPDDNTTPANQVLFSKPGQYLVGFDVSGDLYMQYGNGEKVSTPYENTGEYIHITAVHEADTILSIYVNDSLYVSLEIEFTMATATDEGFYIGSDGANQKFGGYLDEVRLWNKALTATEVANNYSRLMSGNEEGLIAYYRLDEMVKDEFYDSSQKKNVYNANHGYIKPDNADVSDLFIGRSDIIPSPGQLGLKGITDAAGNYYINNIPYEGNGTQYTITPKKGEESPHKFEPSQVYRTMSNGSLSHSIDFTDKSSFDVSGYVFYANTNVPVQGVRFKINGIDATSVNDNTGSYELNESDNDGKFKISVPIGVNKVIAYKDKHILSDGFSVDENDRNYTKDINTIQIWDSTTVRLIGRLSGGAEQDSLAFNHPESKNILGDAPEIKLMLSTYEKGHYLAENSKEEEILHPVITGNPDIKRNTRIKYGTKSALDNKEKSTLTIYPDLKSGEFVADIIPENFLITYVNALGHEIVTDQEQVLDVINLSEATILTPQESIVDYEIKISEDESLSYTDTIIYNFKKNFIKRVSPTMTLKQLVKGKEVDYFGIDSISIKEYDEDFNATDIKISLVHEEDNTPVFGYYLFNQSQYIFQVSAYEEFKYNGETGTGDPLRIPTTDGVVTFTNPLAGNYDSSLSNEVSLNEKGQAYYTFYGGTPKLTTDGEYSSNIQGFLSYGTASQPIPSNIIKGAVLGSATTGTTHTTAGPNKLLAVLRDPPGSKSYAYLAAGSIIESANTKTSVHTQEGNEKLIHMFGADITTNAGTPFLSFQTKIESDNNLGVVGKHNEVWTGANTYTSTTTIEDQIETSADPMYVGRDADILIGKSTNITFGNSEAVKVIHKSFYKEESMDLIEEFGDILLVKGKDINIGTTFNTLFAYTQHRVENEIIPDLMDLRDNIFYKETWGKENLPKVETQLQELANTTNQQVVYSFHEPGTDEYGASNTDSDIFGDDANQDADSIGPGYRIFHPHHEVSITCPDTIFAMNQSINNWYKLLEENEEAKVLTRNNPDLLLRNYSFDAGAKISHSREYSFKKETVKSFEFMVGGGLTTEFGFAVNKFGLKFSLEESYSYNNTNTDTDSEENTRKEGFVLEEDGDDDMLSVDVYYETSFKDTIHGKEREMKGAFVYYTRSGVTCCPYEDTRVTKYYKPGTVLDAATLKIEVPVLEVENATVTNVPAARKANFKLFLRNESEYDEDVWYTLNVLDASNPDGAIITIDGMPLGNTGRSFMVRSFETLEKTLEIGKGPNVMQHENIEFILHSQCQYDPTNDLIEDLYSKVAVSAYFIPSCTDINIRFPLDNWVINTNSSYDSNKGYLQMVELDQYDINSLSLNRIELQYKKPEEAQWKVARKFYRHEEDKENINDDIIDISNSIISYELYTKDHNLSDGAYQLRAVSYCEDGAEFIQTVSDVVNIRIDTQAPLLFGNKQPANGILGIEDNIMLTFNENINTNALSSNNFSITGILNGATTDHNVSVTLDGINDYLATEAERNLEGKDITIEMWVQRASRSDGTVFSHGNINESIELGFTADNCMSLRIGDIYIKSVQLPAFVLNTWAHIAMVYEAKTERATLYYNGKEVLSGATTGTYNGIGAMEIGRSIRSASDYFNGKIHEVRVWDKKIAADDIYAGMYKIMTGSESGLIAYYPLNEGKGKVAFDKVRGANALLFAEWTTPEGRSLRFNNGSLQLPMDELSVRDDMDYTIELWFKAEPGQTNTAILTNAVRYQDDSELNFSEPGKIYIGFNEAGKLIFRSSNTTAIIENNTAQDYRDNNWHHFAASVNRSTQYVEIYMNGELINQYSANNIQGINGGSISIGAVSVTGAYEQVVGKENYFKGNVDEIRLWNAALTHELIEESNTRLHGNEIGLLLYYPFEEYINGEVEETLWDMKLYDDNKRYKAEGENISHVLNAAPVKDRTQISKLTNFSYVVSDKSLIINLEEDPALIEKTTLTFSVDNITDMNGNVREPVMWSAYIDRNMLKWDTDEINLVKEEFVSQEITVDLLNKGGNSQRFTIDNLPAWLNASPVSGTIAPASKQTITFTIREGLNVGRYNEVINARNSSNVNEALSLNVKVEGVRPGWNVNPADYEQNMIVYGQLRIDGIFSNDKEDLIAAFIDNECVGVVNNAWIEKANVWYAFLTVYGNASDNNSPIEFRIWDASTGKTYQAATTETIVFKNQKVYGSSATPLIFDTEELQYQNFNIVKGWNWISFNVTGDNFKDVNRTLGKGWSEGDEIKNENELNAFDSYSALQEKWIGTLSNTGLNNTQLFMLKANNDKYLSVPGTKIDVKTNVIPVSGTKWNFISYLPTVNMSVDEALSGYAAKEGDIIKSQKEFAMFNGRSWIGSLTYLEPGKGYMLYRTESTDGDFTYPAINGSYSSSQIKRSEHEDVYSNYEHAHNMTVVAQVISGVELLQGDHIVAFLDGEKRGSARVKENGNSGIHFLNIVSDEPGAVSFAVEREGSIIANTGTVMMYSINKTAGTLNNPYELNFDVSVDCISAYPSPFRSLLNINLMLTQDSEIEMNVYDLNGRLLKSWTPVLTAKGVHNIPWNAEAYIESGTYVIDVRINGESSTLKVIKQ